MIAEELINPLIPALKPTDLAEKGVQLMEEFRLQQLAVVQDSIYKGLISGDILKNKSGVPISNFSLIAEKIFVNFNQHFYDVVKAANENALEVVAVLNENMEYQGLISVKDTISAFAQTLSVQSPGGILILSLREIDYSLSEISRLVETNHAKIICSYVSADELDMSKLKLTIKINKLDLSHIIATLERYDYKIIAKFQEADQISTDKERLDILLKYLSM